MSSFILNVQNWWCDDQSTKISLLDEKHQRTAPLARLWEPLAHRSIKKHRSSSSVGSLRDQTYCVNTHTVVLFLLPAIVLIISSCFYVRAAADEWASAFIVAWLGEKWPLLLFDCTWIISYYLAFSFPLAKNSSGAVQDQRLTARRKDAQV